MIPRPASEPEPEADLKVPCATGMLPNINNGTSNAHMPPSSLGAITPGLSWHAAACHQCSRRIRLGRFNVCAKPVARPLAPWPCNPAEY